MFYAMPSQAGAKVQFKSQYDNFIGGKVCCAGKGRVFRRVDP